MDGPEDEDGEEDEEALFGGEGGEDAGAYNDGYALRTSSAWGFLQDAVGQRLAERAGAEVRGGGNARRHHALGTCGSLH
jgi:hypothetical protein